MIAAMILRNNLAASIFPPAHPRESGNPEGGFAIWLSLLGPAFAGTSGLDRCG